MDYSQRQHHLDKLKISRRKFCSIFTKHGLSVTAEANLKTVEFLDVIFDLETETFRPYNKPNNIPQYVHKMSNHPPPVLRNIPEGVNKRLSSISSNSEMFNEAAPLYQEALDKSGYDYKLHFNPQTETPSAKNRTRKRHTLWFNPPYNLAVKTNVGHVFPQPTPSEKL